MFKMRQFTSSALALVLLAGCEGGFALPEFNLGGASALPALALHSGALTAVSPTGYCIDAGASRASRGFALLAACDAITGGDARPSINGLIVIQAGVADSASVAGAEDAFRQFLESDAGRAVLSRSGDAETVDLDGTRAGDGQVTVYFDDSAENPIAGVSPHEWRSFLDVNDRLVTVSVHSLLAAPISETAGDSLLDDAVAALLSANSRLADDDT